MQNYKKNFVKQALAWVLAAVMVITMLPVGVFAEVEKADWTINEKKEAEMSFWKLADINEVVVVANAEGMKTPSINYIGTYINAEGRTVVRVSYRVFQNSATAVWQKALFKFDKDLYDLIDFDDTGTGMYKNVDNGKWHDSDTYKEVVQFTDAVSSISGAVNVKEQHLKNNKNLVGAAARIEVPIDLVLKEGKTVADIKGQPHIQMRLAAEDYKRIFCVAGTGKADNDTTDPDQNKIVTPYNSYTFMTYIPSANNNADVNTVEDYNRDLQFYAANSYAKYNEAGGYLDVFHKQSKLNSGYDIGGENFAFRQVFDEKFASVLKPQDASGTVAEVFPAGQQGNMWGNAEPIKITESDLNNSDNSDLNPGFYGIQVASTYKSNIKNKFAGLKTVLTTAKPGESYLNGATTEFNSGLPTITRYYIDKDKVAEKGLTTDDLASFDFYSTFILDSTKKLIEYTATNDTGKDIVLKPNRTIGLTYVDGKTSTPNTQLVKYSLTFGEGPYKIEMRSNFTHTGTLKDKNVGSQYEYKLVPGMTIKAGEKITFRTMKYDTIPTKVILTLPSTDGDKTIELVPGEDGAELTTPRRLSYITTYAGGSATQSGANPDIDEIFTDSQNITGRTRYVGAKIKLFYPDNTDYEFIIAEQKTRTKMNVNGAEVNGYTFTTEGKTGFTMPTGLVKDSKIGITNTDVKKASTPSDKAFEKVQAKVTFDLNGGKLATTVKSFEGFDTTKLPGTEFAYKLQRANDTAPVVRIAPMNEKAAGEEGYTPNGFKVAKYTDHNGDELKGYALELRKFVAEKPTIESTDNLVFLGWTTKKLDKNVVGTILGETISGDLTADQVSKAFNKLQKDKKIAKTADEVNGTEAYIFNDASPITKATTVYAVYGAEFTNDDVIPFEPKDPEKPGDKDDENIPTVNPEDNKPINREDYVVVGFKVDPKDSGTLTLGDQANKAVISALVKKDSKWAEFTMPTTNDGNDYVFWHWDEAPAETVADGQVRVAKFIKSGDEIDPNDNNPLPTGFHKVTVAKGTGIADDTLFGKTYAVKTGDKLAQDKFPELQVSDATQYKDPAWDVKDPWTVAVADKDLTFTASAVSAAFDKNNVTGMEVKTQPDLTYVEGSATEGKLDLSKLVVTLTDKNGNKQDVPFNKLGEYGITANPANGTEMTVDGNNGKPVVLTKDKLTANTDNLVVTKETTPGKPTVKYPNETPIEKGNTETVTPDEVKDKDGKPVEKDKVGRPEITNKDKLPKDITVNPKDNGVVEITVPEDYNGPKDITIKVTVPVDGEKVETEIKVTIKDKYVPVPTPEKSDRPIINPIYDSDDYVTGEGVPGATVEVRFPDGTIERVIVDRDGRWVAPIPYPLYDEEIVEARQIEFGKEPSDWVAERVRYDDEYWRERDRRDRDDKKEDTKKPSKVEPRWTPPALNARDHFSYIKGYGNNIFGPNRTITRAEVAMIFARLSINQSTGGAPQFKDVKAGDWYKTAVDIMARQGVIKGYEDGTFRPNQPITRREFAAIAARYAGNLDTWKTFRDVPPTDWAYKLINRVAGAGWINGYEDGTFRPNNNITRAEVVAIVNRMLNRKADAKYVDNNLMRTKGAFVDNMRSAWYYYDIYEAAFGHSYERLDNGVDEKWNRVTGQAFEIRER